MKMLRPLTPAALDELANRLVADAAEDALRRTLVGIAGIGGAGKSTVAAALVKRCNKRRAGIAHQVPMDGFHLPHAILRERDLLTQKGRPHTFDVAGYRALLKRVRGEMTSHRIPVYDRAVHDVVLDGRPACRMAAGVRIVVTEGNYLLFDQPDWAEVYPLLDMAIWIELPAYVAKARVIARHRRGGKSQEHAEQHYERVDQRNAHEIVEYRLPPDVVLMWQGDEID
jgi:pantothenate kinase